MLLVLKFQLWHFMGLKDEYRIGMKAKLLVGTSISAFQVFLSHSFPELCNKDRVLMCTSTCPEPDCIDLTLFSEYCGYRHNIPIHPVCHLFFSFCSLSFFIHFSRYCWSFSLSLRVNKHCSYKVISHSKCRGMTELTLLFNFFLKWLSMSWNKSGITRII